MRRGIITGHVLDVLPTLPEESVHCVITSPPYYAMRAYGTEPQVWGGDPACVHEWGETIVSRPQTGGIEASGLQRDGRREEVRVAGARQTIERSMHDGSPSVICMNCGAWRGELGGEPLVDCMGYARGEMCAVCYICHLRMVMAALWSVLRDDGVAFINLGDSYANDTKWGGATGGKHVPALHGDTGPGRARKTTGIPAKNLLLVPQRFALAAQADGWIVRNDCVWSKPNGLPESVTDRFAKSHEYILLLAKSPRYFFDIEAIKDPAIRAGTVNTASGSGAKNAESRGIGDAPNGAQRTTWGFTQHDMTTGSHRNPRTVWQIPVQARPEAHFACVDSETEALTPDGWKQHGEIEDGEFIAGFDQQRGVIRWQQATIHRYDYEGSLIAIEKRDTSQRLTPNHRCFVRRKSGVEAVVRADRLRHEMDMRTVAPWAPDECTSIGGAHWAALLAWYIAEGHSDYPGHVTLYQSSSANAPHCDRIRRLLSLVNADAREVVRERTWNGRPSIEHVWYVRGDVAVRLQHAAPAKQMTPALALLVEPEAEAFLEAFIDGDGSRRADGRACIIQKDKRSIDLLQVLALRLGYRAMVRPRGAVFVLYLTRGQWLTIRGTNGAHTTLTTEPYQGTVWCPSIESGFWLARRDGKTFITGNTFPDAIPQKAIAAGTSEHGVCAVCAAPWLRVTEDAAAYRARLGSGWHDHTDDALRGQRGVPPALTEPARQTVGWRPGCRCLAMGPYATEAEYDAWRVVPAVVLDPFLGSGTTAEVAERMGRNWVGIELSQEYVTRIAGRRTAQLGLFQSGAGERAVQTEIPVPEVRATVREMPSAGERAGGDEVPTLVERAVDAERAAECERAACGEIPMPHERAERREIPVALE